ncbi:hypothetical protein KY285_036502 [Solanum tuberosum]|nr:hypothetical protein KY284_036535 [Solanum tuberosum]KAH0639916.1 hypothetical protein KY285_036502 [Solanum tuberosum]
MERPWETRIKILVETETLGIFRYDCREKKECDKRSRRYTSNVRWTPLGQQYSAYSDMIEERRKRVTNGLEDTYGERKSQ